MRSLIKLIKKTYNAAISTVAIEAGIFTITYFTVKKLKFP